MIVFIYRSTINEATKNEDSGECVKNPEEPSNNEDDDDKWDIDLMRARRWNQIVEKLRNFCFICKKEILITEDMYSCVNKPENCDLNVDSYTPLCENCLKDGNCPKCGKKPNFEEALDLEKERDEPRSHNTSKTIFDSTSDDDSGDDVKIPKAPVVKKVQPPKKDDDINAQIINLPDRPEQKIDVTWQKKIDELMKMGEVMENEPINLKILNYELNCSKCSFVTKRYKEFMKHKRVHKRYSQRDYSHLRRHLKRKCRDSPMEAKWKKAMAEAKEESDT